MSLMKYEGQILEEYAGLKSKMYSYQTLGEYFCKAKGITKCTRNTSTLQDYKNCLFSGEPL